MKKVSKGISGILALLICTSTLAACGGGGTSTSPSNSAPASSGSIPAQSAVEDSAKENITRKHVREPFKTFWEKDIEFPFSPEPITVTVMACRSANQPETFDDMWFIKDMAQRTNITFDYKLVEEGAWTERKNLAFASGDYPDMFTQKISMDDELNYGPQGMLVDLVPLLKQYAPNIMELYKTYPDVVKGTIHESGAIYVLPMISYAPRQQTAHCALINTKWLDAVGMKMPTNIDELYTVLKAFKEKDPNQNGQADEIPISKLRRMSESKRANLFLTAFGFVDDYHDVVDGKYIFVPAQPNYRAYLEYMHRLYSEGLIDRDYLVQEEAQFNAKASAGTVGILEEDVYNFLPEEADYLAYAAMPPQTSGSGKACWPQIASHYQRDIASAAITDHCKNPEAVVKFLNYLQTVEGACATRIGPKYGEWEGDGGYTVETMTDQAASGIKQYVPKEYPSFYRFRLFQTPMYLSAYVNPLIDDIIVGGDKKNSQTTLWWMNSGVDEVKRPVYRLQYRLSDAEMTEMARYIDLETYAEQMTAKFITGQEQITNASWESYLDRMESMGLSKMLVLRQKGYENYMALPDSIS